MTTTLEGCLGCTHRELDACIHPLALDSFPTMRLHGSTQGKQGHGCKGGHIHVALDPTLVRRSRAMWPGAYEASAVVECDGYQPREGL